MTNAFSRKIVNLARRNPFPSPVDADKPHGL